jgi:hypothetical protein
MIEFAFSYQGTRNECSVCGGCIEKFEVYAAALEHQKPYAIICPRCIAEPDKIDEKLGQRAVDVEERGRRHAHSLREAVGKLRGLPSHAQWQAESNYLDAAYGTYLKREQWDAWTPEQRRAWEDRDPVLHAAVEASRPPPIAGSSEGFHEMDDDGMAWGSDELTNGDNDDQRRTF